MNAADPIRRIAVLAPMRSELRPLRRPLSLRREAAGHGRLYRGTAGGAEIVATVTGIGTAAAAAAAERVLDAGPIERLVVVGIAGGIGASVAIGDLVVPERVLDLASGATYRPAHFGDVAPRGTLVTSDRLVTDRGTIEGLERQGAIAIDMETAAVAAVCERRKCPWSVYRAISDRADDGSMDAAVLALAGPDGSGDAAAVLRFALTRPWRLSQLARLGRDSRRAAATAARATLRALAARKEGRVSS